LTDHAKPFKTTIAKAEVSYSVFLGVIITSVKKESPNAAPAVNQVNLTADTFMMTMLW